MPERMRRLISGALVLLFDALAGAHVLCALPCGRADPDSPAVAPADGCDGEHARFSPADITPRPAIAPASADVAMPRALRPPPHVDSVVGAPVRSPDIGTAPVIPPLRI